MSVQTLSLFRTGAGRSRAHADNSVMLVLAVMMGIVFGPIIGVHAVAALGAASAPSAPAGAASVVQTSTRSPG